MNTPEIVMDLSDAIHRALKDHNITPTGVSIKVDPERINIVVKLEDEE